MYAHTTPSGEHRTRKRNELRGGYHQEDVEHASAEKEKKSEAQEEMAGLHQGWHEWVRDDERHDAESKCVAQEDKFWYIASSRSHKGDNTICTFSVRSSPPPFNSPTRPSLSRYDRNTPANSETRFSYCTPYFALTGIVAFLMLLRNWPLCAISRANSSMISIA